MVIEHVQGGLESEDKHMQEDIMFTEQPTGITTDFGFGEVIEDDLSDKTVTESDWTCDEHVSSPHNLLKIKDSPELPPGKKLISFADLLKEA